MSVSAINTNGTALLQSALKTSGSDKTSNVFDDFLSEAITGLQNNCNSETSYEEKYDMYAELLEKSSGSSESLLTALMSSYTSGTSSVMLSSLYNALTGKSLVTTGINSIRMAPAATSVEGGSGNVSQKPWVPTEPALTSDVYNRSAQMYTNVIEQFKVDINPRYAPNQKGTGDTYCNIFVWDITSAMGAEIPHYYNAKTGEPMSYGDKGANQMTANRIHDWLNEYGEDYGWYKVTPEEAQGIANQGRPVVTALKRNGAHGHVQVVCPSKDGQFNEQKGVTIAQAGRNLTSNKYISSIYNASLPKVTYYAHM